MGTSAQGSCQWRCFFRRQYFALIMRYQSTVQPLLYLDTSPGVAPPVDSSEKL
jgi:hypothetical protein